MHLNRQEQETIVEERSEELFRDHIRQFLLFAVSYLEFSEVVSVFCNIRKCILDWRTNVIHYFEHFGC